MDQCWAQSPEKRPSFCDLVKTITPILDGVAGYLDLSFKKRYDYLRRTAEQGYDHLDD
jgi:hypothetical protein